MLLMKYHQHRFIAMNNGITEEELSQILTDDKVRSLAPLENLICQAADEMESHATITDDTFRALNEQLDHRELVELFIGNQRILCGGALFEQRENSDRRR
jgi:hypothetical protein